MLWGFFGVVHIVSLLISAGMIVGLYFLLRNRTDRTKVLVLGILSFSGIAAILFNLLTWNSPLEYLPFHLCSIQIIFIAILNLSSNEKLKRFLLSFMYPSCLFGGIAAILIATNSSLNGMWILTLQYFGYHVALVVFSLHLITGDEFKIKMSDYTNCLKFLLVMMFCAFYINSILYDGVSNINFMYVASPPQSGLPFLTEKYGWLVYIVHYAALVIFCVSACYAKPIFMALKSKLKKPKDTDIAEEKEEITSAN